MNDRFYITLLKIKKTYPSSIRLHLSAMSTNSSKKRISFIRFTKKEMEELGFKLNKDDVDGSNTINGCGKSADSKPKIEMIPFNLNMLKEMEEYAGDPPPSRKKNISTSCTDKVNQIRRSTRIGRASCVTKKEIKSNCINAYLGSSNKMKNAQVKSTSIETSKPNIRKQLFKLPETKSRINSFRKPKTTQVNYFKEPKWSVEKCVDQSPLIDLEKAKLLTQTNSFLKENPFRPSILQQETNVSHKEETVSVSIPDVIVSSCSETKGEESTADAEFEALESICSAESPLNVKKEIKKLRRILEEDRMEYEKFKKSHEDRKLRLLKIIEDEENEFNRIHEERTLKLTKLVDIISRTKTTVGFVEKENISPLPTKAKTPSKNSPLHALRSSNKLNDLRMNLLKSNTIKSAKNTPVREKAMNMYNDLRNAFSVLETPNRNCDTLGVRSSNKKNLSIKLQEQCMMLLETPARKES